ncbi:MAG: peptide chain release factor N(5)-glutamine methyltransferase [Clostridiales bacterium]|nr:peptide chain release factor N(5)-glutamine methyltransferase [Clostridiales bacterium]
MVKTYKQAYLEAVNKLKNANIEDAEFDCGCLFEKAFSHDIKTFKFSNRYTENAYKDEILGFEKMIDMRISGEPLQYIIGEWEFYGLDFNIGKGVLIPRQDTESLVDSVINQFKDKSISVVDICAGTGCIGLTLEHYLNVNELKFIELHENAIEYLNQNIKKHNSKGSIIQGDALENATANKVENCDIIVCNPPYLTKQDMENLQSEVRHEPVTALFGGDDGLDFYRGITRVWKNKLNDYGTLVFEIVIGQEDDVMEIMIQHGFVNVRAKKDLCGVYRIVTGSYTKA